MVMVEVMVGNCCGDGDMVAWGRQGQRPSDKLPPSVSIEGMPYPHTQPHKHEGMEVDDEEDEGGEVDDEEGQWKRTKKGSTHKRYTIVD